MPVVDIHGVAKGGAGVGRLDDGRAVFVVGALPDERVEIELTEEKERYARAQVGSVLIANSARIEPPCSHIADGCGGCDMQHATPHLQRELKLQIVRDALERIGKIAEPTIAHGEELPTTGFRTQLRGVVVGGRFALRKRQSHRGVEITNCDVAHPLINDLIDNSTFGTASEVTMRVSAASGERMIIVDPNTRGIEVPDDVVVIGTDELQDGKNASLRETVAGHSFRISARSFFQTRPDGAAQLVQQVKTAAHLATGPMIDLYGGVGLFAATVGAHHDVTVVEQSASSIADARVNLAGRTNASVIRARVERWRPTPAGLVVADPARSGLTKTGVAKVVDTGAPRVVLVSCDPASLGRDAGLLEQAGYKMRYAHLVDIFPGTSHIETVSRFDLV